jgi:guanylate kinase
VSQSGESPEYINTIVDLLRQKEKHYSGGKDVYSSLVGKTMTALAGPMGVGKTTTTTEIINLDDDFAEVNTSTTRARKANDPIGFRTCVSYSEFNDAVAKANLVNFNVIGQNVYGTYQSGFPGKHNVGPIMARSVPQMMGAGFDEVNVVFLLVEEHEYERRLREERIDYSDFTPRVIEGDDSFSFAHLNIDEQWLNFVESSPEEDGAKKAARKVIDIVRHNSSAFLTQPRVLELLDGMHTALHRVARDVH